MAVCALATLLLPAGAFAARAPTPKEEGAIWATVVKKLHPEPAICIGVFARVSTVNSSYAYAQPTWACQKYAANGFYLLRRHGAGWVSIYGGSDPPPCSVVPQRIVTDLLDTKCL